MIAQWDVPFLLTTPSGALPLNQPLDSTTLRRFQLNPEKCSRTLPVRVTEDNNPQADGKIPHRRWRSGYGVHLAIEPLIWDGTEGTEGEPACGEDLVDMLDILGLHLNEMIRTGLVPGAPTARLIWTPTNKDNRMLDRLQLASDPIPSFDGALGGTQVEVDLDTSFPYYIEEQETQTDIGDGGTGGGDTVTNVGNVDYFPVFRIYGPYDAFTLVNTDVVDLDGNQLELVYDASLPGAVSVGGGGDYVEFDFFRGTAFLNGNQANRIGGIDLRVSDFFPLVPGDNDLTVVFSGSGGGTLARCLSNGAWA